MRKVIQLVVGCLLPCLAACGAKEPPRAAAPTGSAPGSASAPATGSAPATASTPALPPKELLVGEWARVGAADGIAWDTFDPNLKNAKALKLRIQKNDEVILLPHERGAGPVLRYSYGTDGGLELTQQSFGSGGAVKATKMKVKAQPGIGELVVTDDKGKTEKFKRESLPPGTPKGNPDELVRKHQVAIKELTAQLQGIKDEGTYKAALPALEKTVLQIQDLDRHIEWLELGPEDGKKLFEKYPDLDKGMQDAEAARRAALKQVPGKAQELDDLLFKAGLARKSFGP